MVNQFAKPSQPAMQGSKNARRFANPSFPAISATKTAGNVHSRTCDCQRSRLYFLGKYGQSFFRHSALREKNSQVTFSGSSISTP